MMNNQVGWNDKEGRGGGGGERRRGSRGRSGRYGSNGRKGDIENFVRDQLMYGNPRKLLRRIESTREGAALIDKERSLGPGWETSVQQTLLGFLDRCRDPGDCKDLAIMMGIDQSNWICQCGNKNYWFRAECNRRQCRRPKPEEEECRPYDPMYDSGFGAPLERPRTDYLDPPNLRAMSEPIARERYDFMDSRREPSDRYRPPREEPGWEYRNGTRRPYDGGARKDRNRTPMWRCPLCQNENYSHRKVCNGRGCDEPRPLEREPISQRLSNGDWECGRCGNLNYASRLVCNMKTCNNPAPRDQGTSRRDDRSIRRNDRSAPRILPNGNWICPKCGNSNYASRVICNIKSCRTPNPLKRRPGDWICPSCNNVNWKDKQECNRPNCRTPRPKAEKREGDWECPKCGNFNFAHREVCNKYSCDEKKPQIMEESFNNSNDGSDGEAIQKRPRSDYSENEFPSKRARMGGPPGSWICRECSNLNYPSRTVCNRRTCGVPRPVPGDVLIQVN